MRGNARVVAALAHVDMVVRVNGLFGAKLAAEDLDGSVRDDLVRVHVGLGTGAGLPDDQGEVVDELKVSHLLGRLLDRLGDSGV